MKKTLSILIVIIMMFTLVNQVIAATIKDPKLKVNNIAPVTGFDISKKKKMQLVLNVGNYPNNTVSYIQSKVNQIVVPKLEANNIDAKINVVDGMDSVYGELLEKAIWPSSMLALHPNGQLYEATNNVGYFQKLNLNLNGNIKKLINDNSLIMEDGRFIEWDDNYKIKVLQDTFKYTGYNGDVLKLNELINVNYSDKDYINYAIERDGTLKTWGEIITNSNGYNGDEFGREDGRFNYPVKINNMPTFEKIIVGKYLNFGITKDGEVWRWQQRWHYPFDKYKYPENYVYNGYLSKQDELTKLNITNVIDVALKTGGNYSSTQYAYFVNSDGTVVDSWGKQVDINNVVDVAAGRTQVLFLKSDGTLYGMGGNYYGQLGLGWTTEYWDDEVPLTKIPIENVVKIFADSDYSYAITKDGYLWSWGSNSGILGLGYKSDYTIIPTRTNLNLGLFRAIGKELNDVFTNLTWEDNRIHFFANLEDTIKPEMSDIDKAGIIQEKLIDNDVNYIGLGKSTNKTQITNIITQNNNSGIFIDNTNLDSALTNVANHIITEVNKQTNLTQYVLINDEIGYEMEYTDKESDPKFEEKWKFTHDPSIFDNTMGRIADSGQYRTAPYNIFSKVGKYDTAYIAKDNPKNDNRFDNYRKWSEESVGKLSIIAHRAPFVDFDVSFIKVLSNGNYQIAITDTSYDLDHTSRADEGIINKVWKWKKPTDINWYTGKPTELAPKTKYLIQEQVQDVEGQWSTKVKLIDTSVVNFAPTMTITQPKGTQSNPIVYTSEPLVKWSTTDPEGDPQEAFELNFDYVSLNEKALKVNQNTTTKQYQPSSSILKKGELIKVYGKVLANEQWSPISNQEYFLINTAPTATIMQPSSTSISNPSIVAQRSTVKWNYYDADSHTQKKYRVYIKRNSDNAILAQSGDITSSNHNWTINKDLPSGVTMYAQVQVYDGYTWGTLSARKYLMINKPPTVTISTTPNYIYEGDTVKVTVSPYDGDGDVVNIVVKQQKNGGSWTNIWSKNGVASGSIQTFNIPSATIGNYSLQATVTDPTGFSGAASTSFTVRQLNVDGQVQHTPNWNENRIQYNQSKTGTDDSPRTYDVFFPGEKFILKAQTTVTQGDSTVQANSVNVQIQGKTYSANLTKVSTGEWEGSLWHEDMMKWSSQTLTFRFTATYNNGTVKTKDILIKIDDDPYWRQHMKF